MRISRLIVVPRRLRLIPLLAALAIGETSFAQPKGPSSIPPGTSTISGVLVDARTKQPIAGCTVAITQVNAARNAVSHDRARWCLRVRRHRRRRVLRQRLLRLASVVLLPERGIRAAPLRHGRCRHRSAEGERRFQPRSRRDRQGPRRRCERQSDCGSNCPAGTATLRRRASRHPNPTQTNRDGTFTLTNLPAGGWLLEVDLPQAPGALRPPIVYFPGVLMFWGCELRRAGGRRDDR